ncbi:MAG: OmpH family outer membrane protein [Armatimonadota bacterium]
MRELTGTPVRVLCAVALAVLTCAAGFAQEGQQDAAVVRRVAVVDMQRLLSQYEAFRAENANLEELKAQRGAWLNRLMEYVFLPKADFEEALELLRKNGELTEQEQQRLEELKQISKQRDEQFANLRAKPDRSAEENTQYNTLNEMAQARLEQIEQIKRELEQELSDRYQTSAEGLREQVRQAIIAQADEGGYDLVVDADAVFVGGEDITDAVIQRLNQATAGGGGEEGAAAEGAEAEGGQAEGGAQQGAEAEGGQTEGGAQEGAEAEGGETEGGQQEGGAEGGAQEGGEGQ